MIVGTGEDRNILRTGPVAPVEEVPGARGVIQIAEGGGGVTPRRNPQPAKDRGILDVRGVRHNGARARKAVARRTGRAAQRRSTPRSAILPARME